MYRVSRFEKVSKQHEPVKYAFTQPIDGFVFNTVLEAAKHRFKSQLSFPLEIQAIDSSGMWSETPVDSDYIKYVTDGVRLEPSSPTEPTWLDKWGIGKN
jgi:hypothetical protein